MKLPAVLAAVDLQKEENGRLNPGGRCGTNWRALCSCLVILANNHVVGVEEIRDVLLDHVVARVQWVLVNTKCVLRG